MISRVRVSGFKKVKDEIFELDRINIFVGANNSGKSSVLQAIQFAIGTAQTASRVPRITKKGGKESFSAETGAFLYLPLRELEALIHDKNLTQSTGADIYFFSDSKVADDTIISIKRGKNRNLSITMKSSSLLDKLKDSQKPYCVYTPGLSGISLSEEFKTKAVVLKSATRGDSNLYLRNVLWLLKGDESDKWEKFSESVRAFFPDYEVNVQFDSEKDEIIDAHIETKTEDGSDITLPIDAIGTSALQILQILSYVYYFEPPMLILDEPDTHLHPNNQRRLISLLNDISLKTGMQVLIATHSRHIIDEARDIATFFWMQDGKLLNRFNGENTQEQFVQVLLDIGAMDSCDLFNPNVEWVICTEDANINMDKYLKCVLESSGFDLNKCKVIPYLGCSKVDSVFCLKSFLELYRPDLKVIVHRDRDYLNEDEVEKIRKKFESQGINIWFTPGTDIESIFLNLEHINNLYPEIGECKAQEIIKQVFTDENLYQISLDRLGKHLLEVENSISDNNRHTPSPIQIANKAKELYETNPSRYIYGKRAIGILKSKLQKILSENPELVRTTKALFQKELNDFIGFEAAD